MPDLPGQALYLARNKMMSAYKDLTDEVPSRIGRPNKFKIPPAYFDADTEPLLDEYYALFDLLDAAPANAQKSDTPFKDAADLGTAIARAKGLDAASAEAAGRISVGIFFAETSGKQNIGNARSNKYKGSFQTGTSEDENGRRKWAATRTCKTPIAWSRVRARPIAYGSSITTAFSSPRTRAIPSTKSGVWSPRRSAFRSSSIRTGKLTMSARSGKRSRSATASMTSALSSACSNWVRACR